MSVGKRAPRSRRFVVFAAAAAVTGVLALAEYRAERTRLVDTAAGDLELLVALRQTELEAALDQGRSQVILWSAYGPLRERMERLRAAWHQFGPGAPETFHRLYVEDNPYPEGQKQRLLNAGDGSRYSVQHDTAQVRVGAFLQAHRFRDVYVIDPSGDVVYSFLKEADFATNLLTGPWKDTALASLFREARELPEGQVAFRGFELYPPSQGRPAAFLGSPMITDAGDLVGVLAVQTSGETLRETMGFTAEMGETGEGYVVGPDYLLRSESRSLDSSSILRQEVRTEPVRRALGGESGRMIAQDYRDIPVIAAFAPMSVEGAVWAVVVQMDLAEALSPLRRTRFTLLVSGVLLLLALYTFLSDPGWRRPRWQQHEI